MTHSHAQRIAVEVRHQLSRKGIGQAQLAAALGVSQAAVSRRLRGEVAFDISELCIVADLLNIPASQLLDAA